MVVELVLVADVVPLVVTCAVALAELAAVGELVLVAVDVATAVIEPVDVAVAVGVMLMFPPLANARLSNWVEVGSRKVSVSFMVVLLIVVTVR